MGFGIVSAVRIAAWVRLKISAKVRDSALRLGSGLRLVLRQGIVQDSVQRQSTAGSGLMHKMKDDSRM